MGVATRGKYLNPWPILTRYCYVKQYGRLGASLYSTGRLVVGNNQYTIHTIAYC